MESIQSIYSSKDRRRSSLRILQKINQILAQIWLKASYAEGYEPLSVVSPPRHPHIHKGEVKASTVAATHRFLSRKAAKSDQSLQKRRFRKFQHMHVLTGLNTIAVVAIIIATAFGKFSLPKNEPLTTTATPTATPAVRFLPIVPIVKTEPLQIHESIQTHHTALSAWVTPWNITDLGNQATEFKTVSAFWATVGSDGYSIEEKGDFTGWRTFKSLLKPETKTFLTISGNPDVTVKTISNTQTREIFVANLINLLKQEQFSGVDIDFEALGNTNKEAFTNFIASILPPLQSQGLLLAVTLEARLANQVPMDWQAIGQLADSVRIMAYDYHSQETSVPGAISPLGWFEEVVRYAVTLIPPQKLSIGLPNYGYAWTEPENSSEKWQGSGISYASAVTIAEANGADIVRRDGIDERGYLVGSSPSFQYTDISGRRVEVWFEDATSLNEKLSITDTFRNLDSAILWSIGSGDAKLWENQ